ncbi:hypothetical protein L0222_14480 [bacterium]|nr:hypothetical protein [bacterium]MCI0601531.1 hypothetical protein [bacterium]
MVKKNSNGPKKGKVLDLNTRILIGIRDELERHTSILDKHTSILDKHTSILEEHSRRLTAVEGAVKELARETRRWVAHFDRDYMRLATEFDMIRSRVEICEKRLSTRP